MTVSEGTCPRCNQHTMMTPIEINALSRTTRKVNDVSMWVCSECGMDEGLEDAFLSGATKQEHWPLDERTFDYFIRETNLAYADLLNEGEGNG